MCVVCLLLIFADSDIYSVYLWCLLINRSIWNVFFVCIFALILEENLQNSVKLEKGRKCCILDSSTIRNGLLITQSS